MSHGVHTYGDQMQQFSGSARTYGDQMQQFSGNAHTLLQLPSAALSFWCELTHSIL